MGRALQAQAREAPEAEEGGKVKLNRRTQPLVYTRVAMKPKTEVQRDREEQDALLRDAVLLAYGFGFLIFLFLVIR
jgi:hypothetical protein